MTFARLSMKGKKPE
jgi:hypothetical protein